MAEVVEVVVALRLVRYDRTARQSDARIAPVNNGALRERRGVGDEVRFVLHVPRQIGENRCGCALNREKIAGMSGSVLDVETPAAPR